MHHGLLPAGRGRHPGRRPRAGDRQSARGARARPRHGLPALHLGPGHDGDREFRARARRAAGGGGLAARDEASSKPSSTRMPFRVPLAAKVSAISAGERQKCEILKQLYLQRRFLILDEPTSVLTPGEADEVLGHAARHGEARRPHRADDHAQVSRGHGVCRRGHDPAARPSRRCGTRLPSSRPTPWPA